MYYINKDVIESLIDNLKNIKLEYSYEYRVIGETITHLEYYSKLLQKLNDRTTDNK